MRLASDLRFISERLPVDLGVIGAAAGAAEALKLLLEVCTVRSIDDPRAETITINLSRAQDQLATAAERIATLFQAGRDVAATITEAAGQKPTPSRSDERSGSCTDPRHRPASRATPSPPPRPKTGRRRLPRPDRSIQAKLDAALELYWWSAGAWSEPILSHEIRERGRISPPTTTAAPPLILSTPGVPAYGSRRRADGERHPLTAPVSDRRRPGLGQRHARHGDHPMARRELTYIHDNGYRYNLP